MHLPALLNGLSVEPELGKHRLDLRRILALHGDDVHVAKLVLLPFAWGNVQRLNHFLDPLDVLLWSANEQEVRLTCRGDAEVLLGRHGLIAIGNVLLSGLASRARPRCVLGA